MKYQFICGIIIFLTISGCQSLNKFDNSALVVTPVELPFSSEKSMIPMVLYDYISLHDFLKNKGFKVETVSSDPLIYKISDQNGLLEELAKILKTLKTIINVYNMNMVMANATMTDTGKPYRRKGFIINKDFEIEKMVDVPGDFKKVYDPGHPDADDGGYLFLPNVNKVEEANCIMNMQKLENEIISIIEKINRNSVAFGSTDYYKLHLSD